MTRQTDTRNNWITLQILPKCRYKCFRRQSVIDTCIAGFRELEAFGFEFGPMAFPIDHAHLSLNLPKKYSMRDALIMLKSHSAKRIFAEHPGFRKRYPRAAVSGLNMSITSRLAGRARKMQKTTFETS